MRAGPVIVYAALYKNPTFTFYLYQAGFGQFAESARLRATAENSNQKWFDSWDSLVEV